MSARRPTAEFFYADRYTRKINNNDKNNIVVPFRRIFFFSLLRCLRRKANANILRDNRAPDKPEI